MKKINKALLLFVGGLFAFSSCNDWTEMEIKNPGDLTHTNKSEAYYAQLRAYKNSDHQKSFGWFVLPTLFKDFPTAPTLFRFGETGKIHLRHSSTICVSFSKRRAQRHSFAA